MPRIGGVAILIGAALALAACTAGGGGRDAGGTGPGGEDHATTTRSTPRRTSSTTKPPPLGPSRAAYSVEFGKQLADIDQGDRCFAGRMVDAIGVERLHSAGVTPEELAGREVFGKLQVTAAERADLQAQAAEAVEMCGAGKKLALDYLTDDDPTWNLTAFAPCVAVPLNPLLASIIIRAWAGELTGSLVDEVSDALAVADAGCPSMQVEIVARAARNNGRTLTASEHACLLARYTATAAEHRAAVPPDDPNIAPACLGG